ncbi:MAG TPA: 4a-hydroxytetrahydrobiopterin dehydratase [Candidatus Limnocylindria bacterium]|nr:4a-hydroxytetrahydrobiopterin dehydratase [Candidatus Limnocylindria bacterium]
MSRLDEGAIAEALRQRPGWRRDGKAITKSWRFEDFREAMAFVNAVAAVAERANHHPDIALHDFKDVTLRLWTHHDDGVTAHDLALARAVEGLPGASRPA